LCTHTSTRLFNLQNGYTYESGDGTVQALSIEWEQVQRTLQVVYKAYYILYTVHTDSADSLEHALQYYILYTVPTDSADSLEHALQVACINELSRKPVSTNSPGSLYKRTLQGACINELSR
jgi:hypothetical protein